MARLAEPPPAYVKRDYQTKSELNYKETGNKRHVDEDPSDELAVTKPAKSIAPQPYDYIRNMDELTEGPLSAYLNPRQQEQSELDYKGEEKFNIWQHPTILDI